MIMHLVRLTSPLHFLKKKIQEKGEVHQCFSPTMSLAKGRKAKP